MAQATALHHQERAILPLHAGGHEQFISINGHLFRVRTWTEREWAQTPERDRPANAIPYADGFGWSVYEPVDSPS